MRTEEAEIKMLKLPSPSKPGASQCRLCTALLRLDYSTIVLYKTYLITQFKVEGSERETRRVLF